MVKSLQKIYNQLAIWSLIPLKLLLSLGYYLVMQVRNLLYDLKILPSYKVNVRTVSIGNISAGGTGKTPFAELLLRWFSQKGARPAYLSRGYGRITKGYIRVQLGVHTAREVGDEALQVATKFPNIPVVVCEDRVAGCKRLLSEENLDVIILDDAFQHRRIKRSRNVVMIDYTRPPWKDYPLPWGMLREPVSSLSRADLVVVTKSTNSDRSFKEFKEHITQPSCYTNLRSDGLVPFTPNNDPVPAENMYRRACVAFSGLGNNDQFHNHLLSLGLQVFKYYGFVDHHMYRPRDIKQVTRRYKRMANKDLQLLEPLIILTSEKDYMRLKDADWFKEEFSEFPFYYISVVIEFVEGRSKFEAAFKPLLPAHSAHESSRLPGDTDLPE